MSAELHYSRMVNGTPRYLGTIAANTTTNNHDTASPFNNTGMALKGKVLLLQSDAACHVACGTTNAVTVTTSNGVKLAADERVLIHMNEDDGYGWIAVVGAANVKVFELK